MSTRNAPQQKDPPQIWVDKTGRLVRSIDGLEQKQDQQQQQQPADEDDGATKKPKAEDGLLFSQSAHSNDVFEESWHHNTQGDGETDEVLELMEKEMRDS